MSGEAECGNPAVSHADSWSVSFRVFRTVNFMLLFNPFETRSVFYINFDIRFEIRFQK